MFMEESMEPTFFEQLQILLVKLNEAFPARDGKNHNITLTDEGHVQISVWDKASDGKVHSWFIAIEPEDELMSFDDVIEVLTKYARENAN
jgi:hypothetical protein